MASKNDEGAAFLILVFVSAVIGACISFGINGTIQSAFLGFGIGAVIPIIMLML
jgi:hypothetical protein